MKVNAKRIAAIAAVSAGLVSVCGCQSRMKEYDDNLAVGNYAQAALIATEEAEDGSGDELMWRLMSGSANRMAGASSVAIEQFDRAEDVMIDHDGTSVFSKGATGAWAMMTNDGAFAYDGGGQDRIFTCFYKAVDYAANGNVAAARTEFNRAAQHQENWIHARRKDIAAANERMQKDINAYQKEKSSQGAVQNSVDNDRVVAKAFNDPTLSSQIRSKCGFDTRTSGILDALQPVDWMNPYVAHVTGVFRWLIGDNGQGFMKDAAVCCQNNAVVSRDMAECASGVKPNNQVWVWIEDGLCPRREEWRIDLPLILIPYMNNYILYAGMALPYLVYRETAGVNWMVESSKGGLHATELTDMDAKIKLEYDVYMRGALAREITRVVVKAGTQVALGVVAENVSDTTTRISLKASQLAAAAWAASVTAADTRCWSSLPKKVHVVRVDRPADGVLSISNSTGPVAQVSLPTGNSMVFVTKPTAYAPAAVKVLTYP